MDRAALVTLYEAMDGVNWKNNTNWLSEAPLGEWYSVITGLSGRVTELDLSENQLSGAIPPELGNLANLTKLYLSENQLSGAIPPELGNLANLRYLSLRGNQLNGCVPRSQEGLLFVSDLRGLPFCSGATATVAGSGADDDHANSEEGATAVSVGEAASGVLEHGDDTDFFVFQSEEGVLYQIDVALGTLSDSTVALHDADGRELAYNDDHGDSLASRIFWEAPTSGEHYVEVAGLGSSGSYTPTVAVR